MAHSPSTPNGYHRYHIETQEALDIHPWPNRFKARVGKPGLAIHLLKEFIRNKADMEVVLSRPCLYGVYSGPVGGFWPRPQKCVACLRCMIEYAHFVQISPNPKRRQLGDSYFNWKYVEAIIYEAEAGRIPVKGAGYRGEFGGEGWDGMWTDMSEIVRPTRDGIHGREYISTSVDIGAKPLFLSLDEFGQPYGELPQVINIPLPFFFDVASAAVASSKLNKILAQAAEEVASLVVLPIKDILYDNMRGSHLVPLVTPDEAERVHILPSRPRIVEMEGWDEGLYREIRTSLPETLVCLRIPFTAGKALLSYADKGIRVFHLTANYHGCSPEGTFVFDLIRAAHNTLVETHRRDEFTLLGSGGIIAAEHIPKAIIAGLDAVALDTPLLIAMDGQLGQGKNELVDRHKGRCHLPGNMPPAWAVQRLKNLVAAWHGQLLEVLGAMGLREVRRLRGEIGRALFEKELEREAFAGIEGYHGA